MIEFKFKLNGAPCRLNVLVNKRHADKLERWSKAHKIQLNPIRQAIKT